MRADELVLRPSVSPLVMLYPLLLVSLFGAFSLPPVLRVLCLAWFAFIVAVTAGHALTPPRLSPRGIRFAARMVVGFRYHSIVPWDGVGRIWTDGPSIRVRLRDPDAAAGGDARLRARMRYHRARYGADLLLPMPAGEQGRLAVADAVARFGGGRLRLERAHVDPVPGSFDVVIGDNRAFLFLLLIGLPLAVPWTFVMGAIEGGESPLLPLAVAVALTAVAVPAGVRIAGPLYAPHIIGPRGLRLRVVRPFAYDLEVPWARVERIWHSRYHGRPAVLVHLDDPDAVAGGDPRLRSRMRRNRARSGADLIIPTAGSNMDESYLALAVAHRSGGTRRLEHVA
ncbi:hypothetical protein [Catenuloplanes atrovinosus]|uniref:Uncharacterized protein n=1 Tax=Catenuloplanes atrovinosus TaxID=137266 RepID=A0AAE4C7F6_9ACTN|nr:hypothetical protein [Catenuloplanes atrovinosus]MDR7273823.1 hypothetical protein [Catenuloplanes atrovinosus]